MRIYGTIIEVNKHKRIYGVKTKYQVYYIYLKRSLMQTFKNYLKDGYLIDLEVGNPSIKGKYNLYPVLYMNKIKSFTTNKVYYSIDSNIDSLKHLLNDMKNILFIDLEMTMPPYNTKGPFNSEIIQVGCILYNNDEEILNYNNYVKPTTYLNNRTCDFLTLDKKAFYQFSVSYYKAYKDLKSILKKYKPTIIVYGKNDILALKKSFIEYKLPNILNYARIINLSSLIQNFYHHQEEHGLFNLYSEFYHNDLVQEHNALSDALITYYVFKAFKEDVLNSL